ncbi:MAG: hypothetical protein FJ086_02985 [Deltaproteobacteria bacterium]|nr:hypothetical protein [Deltaproteobacteria bacterium]
MRTRAWAVAGLAVALSGCITEGRGVRDRGAGGLFGKAELVKRPVSPRCLKYGKGSARAACDEAQELAQRYVRGLSTADLVCLEGGFGDPPAGSCLARATVSDAGNGQLLLDIREAQPSSRWFNHVSSEVWFEDGALVDLYLAERGY